MIIRTDSALWAKLFVNMREYMFRTNSYNGPIYDSETYESFFTKNDIRVIHATGPDLQNKWEFIELPDGDEFIHLMLKWG